MEHNVITAWKAEEREFVPKTRDWYWTVGIVGAACAIAAAILGNFLLALISILAACAVMLTASQKPVRHTYKLTERGFMIGTEILPYERMVRFSISEPRSETEAPHLTIETKSLMGIVSAPLENVDWRHVRTELKNRDIEEVEHLDTLVAGIERILGF